MLLNRHVHKPRMDFVLMMKLIKDAKLLTSKPNYAIFKSHVFVIAKVLMNNYVFR